MKKVIFQTSISIDGYVEGPLHEIDWHIVDAEFIFEGDSSVCPFVALRRPSSRPSRHGSI
jgi:hypothetical protein